MGKEVTNATERDVASRAGFGPHWASLAAPPGPCAPRGAHGCRRHRALASSASGCGACGPRVWPAPHRPRAHDGVRRTARRTARSPRRPSTVDTAGSSRDPGSPPASAAAPSSRQSRHGGPRGSASRRPSRVPPARSRSSLGSGSHRSRGRGQVPPAPDHGRPSAGTPGSRAPARTRRSSSRSCAGSARASGSESAARGVPTPGSWRRAPCAAASIPAPTRLSGPPAGSGRHGPRNSCPAGRRRTGRASAARL